MALFPAALFLLLIGLETAAALRLNDGHLTYTLDDPYIHLALADNIARGHYGVNRQEASAPSSTIVWPPLLALFARVRGFEYVPFAINLAASLMTIWLYRRVVERALDGYEGGRRTLYVTTLVALLVPATNLVGLVFTGMEHSLQVTATAAVIAGMIEEHRAGRVRWWLCAAILAGPLLRYENLAVSVPALVYLMARGHVVAAAWCGIALAGALAGFSSFLWSLGLGLLPTSVLAKSVVAGAGHSIRAMVSSVLRTALRNLTAWQVVALGLAFIALTAVAASRERSGKDRLLAGCVAGGIALHMLAGQFGWYFRYEVYIWVAAVLTVIYLYGARVARALEGMPAGRLVMTGTAIVVVLCFPYVNGLRTIPLASNNIYQQQYQMHRFATDYYRAPVAVNDLGWVSFKNDQYVLDLVGLASVEAFARRVSENDRVWLEDLTRRHDVRLAMVYQDWFGIPPRWTCLGRLHLGRQRITVVENAVTFYALDDEATRRARELLDRFRASLPAGVTFKTSCAG